MIASYAPPLQRLENTGVQRFSQTTEDHGDNLRKNVISTIASIVIGIFAAIGAFFLCAIFLPFIPFEATLGLSILSGLGVGIGSFFAVKYLLKQVDLSAPSRPDQNSGTRPVTSWTSAINEAKKEAIAQLMKKISLFPYQVVDRKNKLQNLVKELYQSGAEQISNFRKSDLISEKEQEFLITSLKEVDTMVNMYLGIYESSVQSRFRLLKQAIKMPGMTKDGLEQVHKTLKTQLNQEVPEQKKIIEDSIASLKTKTEELKQPHNNEYNEALDFITESACNSLVKCFSDFLKNHSQIVNIAKEAAEIWEE